MKTVVETAYGHVAGFNDDGLNKWLGVPYAKPPTGSLRFKHAEKCKPWPGIKETKKYGSKPYQFLNLNITHIPEDEDCLYLNIWAPENARNLPVFVWIYGGGYCIGESSDPSYDGTHFAKEEIVYVNFNYRLGVLGFYDFTMYDCGFDSNCGLSDQIQVLAWIKENIAAFGGNPNNITIAGESAGASSVINLMTAPRAKGLFHKAIAESPLPGWVFNHTTAKLHTDLFLSKMQLNPHEIPQLETMSIEKMKKAAVFVINKACSYHPGVFLPGPVLDDLLPEFPTSALLKESASNIPLIIGTNKDEGSLFVKKIKSWFPDNWEEVRMMLKCNNCEDKLDDLRALYRELPKKDQMSALACDRAFLIDSIKTSDAQTLHASVFMYRFDYEPRLGKLMRLKAPHSAEIAIVLNNLGKGVFSYVLRGSPKEIVRKLRTDMHMAWINFAKTGNPNGYLDIEWPKYDTKKRSTYIFNTYNHIEINPAQKNYEVWKDIELYVK